MKLWSILKLIFGVFLLGVFANGAAEGDILASAMSGAVYIGYLCIGLYLLFGYLMKTGVVTKKEMEFMRIARISLLALLTVAFLVTVLITFLHVLN